MSLSNLLKKKEENIDELRDEDLLELSIENPNYFKYLIRRHEKAFLRKAVSILYIKEDAEDVVQETFVKIYKNASSFTEVPGAQFTSWAYRILINTAITRYNKVKKVRDNGVLISEEMEAVLFDVDEQLRFEDKINLDYLLSLINKLPELLKRTVTLYALDGLSYAEVAELESVNEGVVRTRLHRAKKILNELHKENI